MNLKLIDKTVFVSSESAIQILAEMIHYGAAKTAQFAFACRGDGCHRECHLTGTDSHHRDQDIVGNAFAPEPRRINGRAQRGES